jgi:hypothetical protein
MPFSLHDAQGNLYIVSTTCVNGHETIIAICCRHFEWVNFQRSLGLPLQLEGKNSPSKVCFGREQRFTRQGLGFWHVYWNYTIYV